MAKNNNNKIKSSIFSLPSATWHFFQYRSFCDQENQDSSISYYSCCRDRELGFILIYYFKGDLSLAPSLSRVNKEGRTLLYHNSCWFCFTSILIN